MLGRNRCSYRKVKSWIDDRDAVDVCAVVRGRTVLMGWPGVFLTLAALRVSVAMRYGRCCRLVMHLAVSQHTENRLHARGGSHDQ